MSDLTTTPWTLVLFGMFIGWIIEWVVDLLFSRKRFQKGNDERMSGWRRS